MKTKLPKDFKYLFWSYNFSSIDPEKHRDRIIINTINYGQWRHWKWLIKTYGRENLKRTIENIPMSEFRQRALKLISFLLDIRKFKYVSRSDKIKAEKNI